MTEADQSSTQLVLENLQQLIDALLLENSRLRSTVEDANLEVSSLSDDLARLRRDVAARDRREAEVRHYVTNIISDIQRRSAQARSSAQFPQQIATSVRSSMRHLRPHPFPISSSNNDDPESQLHPNETQHVQQAPQTHTADVHHHSASISSPATSTIPALAQLVLADANLANKSPVASATPEPSIVQTPPSLSSQQQLDPLEGIHELAIPTASYTENVFDKSAQDLNQHSEQHSITAVERNVESEEQLIGETVERTDAPSTVIVTTQAIEYTQSVLTQPHTDSEEGNTLPLPTPDEQENAARELQEQEHVQLVGLTGISDKRENINQTHEHQDPEDSRHDQDQSSEKSNEHLENDVVPLEQEHPPRGLQHEDGNEQKSPQKPDDSDKEPHSDIIPADQPKEAMEDDSRSESAIDTSLLLLPTALASEALLKSESGDETAPDETAPTQPTEARSQSPARSSLAENAGGSAQLTMHHPNEPIATPGTLEKDKTPEAKGESAVGSPSQKPISISPSLHSALSAEHAESNSAGEVTLTKNVEKEEHPAVAQDAPPAVTGEGTNIGESEDGLSTTPGGAPGNQEQAPLSDSNELAQDGKATVQVEPQQLSGGEEGKHQEENDSESGTLSEPYESSALRAKNSLKTRLHSFMNIPAVAHALPKREDPPDEIAKKLYETGTSVQDTCSSVYRVIRKPSRPGSSKREKGKGRLIEFATMRPQSDEVLPWKALEGSEYIDVANGSLAVRPSAAVAMKQGTVMLDANLRVLEPVRKPARRRDFCYISPEYPDGTSLPYIPVNNIVLQCKPLNWSADGTYAVEKVQLSFPMKVFDTLIGIATQAYQNRYPGAVVRCDARASSKRVKKIVSIDSDSKIDVSVFSEKSKRIGVMEALSLVNTDIAGLVLLYLGVDAKNEDGSLAELSFRLHSMVMRRIVKKKIVEK